MPEFNWLLSADVEEIEKASIYWVYLHEHFHHTGYLPIPEYLHVKNVKALAGLEELRVDICSILYLWKNSSCNNERLHNFAYFILAERLLRYAVEGIPYPNYDAIASQFLFKYLQNSKVIMIKNENIFFENDINIMNSLEEFLQLINNVELSIITCSPLEVKNKLLKLLQKYTVYDEKANTYYHSDFFKMIKEKYLV